MKTRAMGGRRPGRGGVAAVMLAAGLGLGVGPLMAQPSTPPTPPPARVSPPATAPTPKPVPGERSTSLNALGERAMAGNSGWEAAAASFGGFKAATTPSRDATMQFQTNSEIREVLARGGQSVKRGDVLIRARDAEVLAAMESQKALASNDLEVRGADKQAELATIKLNALKTGGSFSTYEFDEARVQADISKLQADQARKNLEQQQIKLKQLQGQYERYYLEAPFDGVIEEVMVEVGQGVTEQEKILRIVNTEKLWLDPYADTGETIRLKLKEGSPAWVLVELPDGPEVVPGKVVYVSPVADSVSQTRRVRVEIDNPDGWPAGTQARVRFTPPSGEWKTKAGPGTGVSGIINPRHGETAGLAPLAASTEGAAK